jgi:hypothetical protein
VQWLGVLYPGDVGAAGGPIALPFNRSVSREAVRTLPAATPLSTPYWLREDGTPGRFRVDDAALIGRPDNPPVYPLGEVFAVGGQTLIIPDEPVQIAVDPLRGEVRRPLQAIPPVALNFLHPSHHGRGDRRPRGQRRPAAPAGAGRLDRLPGGAGL